MSCAVAAPKSSLHGVTPLADPFRNGLWKSLLEPSPTAPTVIWDRRSGVTRLAKVSIRRLTVPSPPAAMNRRSPCRRHSAPLGQRSASPSGGVEQHEHVRPAPSRAAVLG